jgi:hypothetical protein
MRYNIVEAYYFRYSSGLCTYYCSTAAQGLSTYKGKALVQAWKHKHIYAVHDCRHI